MGAYEDAIEAVREAGLEDIAETLEGFKASSLREKASKADRLERELAEAQARVRKLETRPKLEEAFRKAGVDFDSLRPAEREAIFALDVEDEISSEFVAEVVSKYELPTVEGGNVGDADEAPSAAAVVAAAVNAPQRRQGGTSTLSPEDTADWSTEKLMRLRQAHPEEFEALKRGETVTGIAFS